MNLIINKHEYNVMYSLQAKQELEMERDLLLSKLASLEAESVENAQMKAHLTAQVKQSQNHILQLNQEAKDMNLAMDELQQKRASTITVLVLEASLIEYVSCV